jgi:hypothetical protein
VRNRPALTPKGERESAERQRRLAAALRANLRKRKTQRSARSGATPGDKESVPPGRKEPGQD